MWYSVALAKFHWFRINWHVLNQSECINFCLSILSFRKSRHKPNLENTSKYGFPPSRGKNGGVLSMRMQVILDSLDSSFARPGSGPIWGGKKGEFRDWTNGLTDQSLWMDQTYNIIDWQTLFIWLWKWLPLRLSKRQSRPRTTLTRTITLFELMLDKLKVFMCVFLSPFVFLRQCFIHDDKKGYTRKT